MQLNNNSIIKTEHKTNITNINNKTNKTFRRNT